MRGKMKQNKPNTIILICSGILLLCVVAVILLKITNSLASKDTSWRTKTSPLPETTVQDLCKVLLLPKNHSLCIIGGSVYADDFYSIIINEMPKDKSTYTEVNGKLGKYQIRKGLTFSFQDGRRYFDVDYDLRGDNITIIRYYFWEDNNICFDILTRRGEDDY